jgi:hypothetical protein
MQHLLQSSSTQLCLRSSPINALAPPKQKFGDELIDQNSLRAFVRTTVFKMIWEELRSEFVW